MNEFQDLEWTIPKIQKLFTQNPRRSKSALFRRFRNHKHLSLIGDYPILATIVNTVKELGIGIKRQNLFYAFNKSDELKGFPRNDKQQLIGQLLKSSSVQFSKGINRARNGFSSKDDTLPIQTPPF